MVRLLSIVVVLLLIAVTAVGAIVFHEDIATFSDVVMAERDIDRLMDQNRPEDAVFRYQEALNAHPNHAGLSLGLAKLHLQLRQPDKAEAVLQPLISDPNRAKKANTHPERNDPAIVVTLAKAYVDQGKYNPAVSLLKELIALHPDYTPALEHLGALYAQAAEDPKEHRGATKKLLRQWAVYYHLLAVHRDPGNLLERFRLGVLFQRLNQPEYAAYQYCQLLTQRPTHFQGRYNLGLTLVDMKHYDEGFRQLDKAVQTLADTDNYQAARQGAESVQGIKNFVALNEDRLGLAGETPPLPAAITEGCL